MSDSEEDYVEEEEQPIASKSKEKSEKDDRSSKRSPSKPKPGRGGKAEKKQKAAKPAKQPKKKKESKGKQGVGDKELKQTVLDYMQKQNRPYNLLNIFDNLHGKIKKPLLESILVQLAEEKKLTCKPFGKNLVYFINQESLNVDKETVDKMADKYHELRSQEQGLSEIYKKNLDQLKRLMSRKTVNTIKVDIAAKEKSISQLQHKRDKLMSVDSEKVDQKEVEKIQKEQAYLSKQLKKRRRLTKDCLSAWAQMLQKKVAEVAEMMGVDI